MPVASLPGASSGGLFGGLFGGSRAPWSAGAPTPPASIPEAPTRPTPAGGDIDNWFLDRLFGRQPKFTRADFIPIARFTEGPMALVVNAETPYKTLKDLVDDAKKNPDKIVFSSS